MSLKNYADNLSIGRRGNLPTACGCTDRNAAFKSHMQEVRRSVIGEPDGLPADGLRQRQLNSQWLNREAAKG